MAETEGTAPRRRGAVPLTVLTSRTLWTYFARLFRRRTVFIDLYADAEIEIAGNAVRVTQGAIVGHDIVSADFFFFPDSTERFLLAPFGSALETDELLARSRTAFAISFLDSLSRKSFVGNRPFNCLRAANRGAFYRFRETIMPTDWRVVSTLQADRRSDERVAVLRFLPDTHVWIDDSATVPQLLTPTVRSALQEFLLPVGIEPFHAYPFDVRVFAFDQSFCGVAWRRSPRPEIVDVRAVGQPLEGFRIEMTDRLTDLVVKIQREFGLAFVAVDFVSDLENIYFPVDLNISPTWNWLDPEIRSFLDHAFATFIDTGSIE